MHLHFRESILFFTVCLLLSVTGYAQTAGTATITVTQPLVRPTGTSAAKIIITVNGVQVSQLTSNGESFSQIAQDIAAAFPNTGAPVTAVASGSTIRLTATTTGRATNYSLSCSIQAPKVPTFALSCPSTLTGGN